MIPEVVPQTVPLFAAELVETGECLAYLHLTGYHAALNSAKIEVGAVHLYETTLSGAKLSWNYEVVAVFDGDRGDLGQAVAYKPLHDPTRVIVAFRAVRVDDNGPSFSPTGHTIDVDAMLDESFLKTKWLPSEAKMSRGICRHAGTVWALGKKGGLMQWLLTHCSTLAVHFIGLSLAGALAQATALRATIEQGETGIGDRAHVFTFGALPWGNAGAADIYLQYLGQRTMHLVTRATQFAVDALPWWEEIDAPVDLNEQASAPASLTASPSEPERRGDPAAAASPALAAIPSRVSVYSVLDPLTAAFAPDHAVFPHTFAVDSLARYYVRPPSDGLPWSPPSYDDSSREEVREEATSSRSQSFAESDSTRSRASSADEFGAGAQSSAAAESSTGAHAKAVDSWTSGAVLRALTQWPSALVPPRQLAALMANKLSADAPLVADYMRLHRGRAYKAALKSLVDLAICRARERGEDEATKPVPRIHRISSKRTLDEVWSDENASGANERSPQDRLSKVASYGSLADKLDEIDFGMC